jgi:RNA 2',3'-cyclic 3'-phosphodiesterase
LQSEHLQTQKLATRRLYFALWPTEAVRQQITERVQPLLSKRNARLIPPANLHVTLAFLGSVSDDALAHIMDAAGQIDSAAFDLTFDHVETWASAHIACLAITPAPAPLGRLVDCLRSSLWARNIEADPKEFKAHVTLARDWREEPLNERVDPLIWPATQFVLVESRAGHAGSEYTILNRWPLAARIED